ncbi:MAG: hypothetical protein AMXMBFR82_26530 [Candidatus Hydrogenedentota bacterium]
MEKRKQRYGEEGQSRGEANAEPAQLDQCASAKRDRLRQYEEKQEQ